VGASALTALLAGCGSPRGVTPAASPTPSPPKILAPKPLADVLILEAAGAQPEDTVVSVPAGLGRVVVLRRSAPDFGLFARLDFPEKSLIAPAGASAARLTVRPRPGLYALDLSIEGTLAAGAVIVFSYGAHFVAPSGARDRYGSDLAFERELAIGRLDADGQVVFLPTSRPGADMLSAPLPGPGRYLVAAPR
jgi:hypothetical protein